MFAEIGQDQPGVDHRGALQGRHAPQEEQALETRTKQGFISNWKHKNRLSTTGQRFYCYAKKHQNKVKSNETFGHSEAGWQNPARLMFIPRIPPDSPGMLRQIPPAGFAGCQPCFEGITARKTLTTHLQEPIKWNPSDEEI